MAHVEVVISHPVGSAVWVWVPLLGMEPALLKVKSISIWVDRYRTKVYYLFETGAHESRLVSNIESDSMFLTREEAIDARDAYISRVRQRV